MIREKLVEGYDEGMVGKVGLIAHGRGEAFDYLIGERTIPQANRAERICSAYLLLAERPVISVNGNTCALVGQEIVELANLIPAVLEVNLFYRTEDRVRKIASRLRDLGAEKVLGERPDAEIPTLKGARALSSKDGCYSADVVFVPLEDGDRAEALKRLGKRVIAVDLNPLSRTAKTADVTIVDNVVRAVPNIIRHVKELKGKAGLERVVRDFDNKENLKGVLAYISERLSVLEF